MVTINCYIINKMKNLITIATLFLLGTIQLIAQSDFRSGYVIKNNNDTIYGLLDYKNNNANAQKCTFRKDIKSKDQLFTPEEIKAYRFTNSNYYISKSITTKNETKKLFLEYLIKGIVDIFYYSDNGDHYFVNDSKNNLRELKNEKIKIEKNNTHYFNEKKEYIGILKVIFEKSPSIINRINKVDLTQKSLIKITHDYHNEVCPNKTCLIYEKKLTKSKSTFGFLAELNGISFSETGEFSADYYYLENSQFGFEVFPSIGLYYKVSMPSINENLYFQYELTYSSVKLKANNSYTEPVYEGTYYNQIEFTLNSFNNVAVLKYEFPKGKIRPTFQFGGFVNYLNTKGYNRNLKLVYPWTEEVYTEQTDGSPFEKFDFGLNFAVGLKSFYMNDKELSIDLRYQRGFGFVKNMNTNILSINLGFQIGK